MADHDPSEVSTKSFDATYWQWLEAALNEYGMSKGDRSRIEALWCRVRERSMA